MLRLPQDDIYAFLEESLPELQDGDVLLITSKILAIHQGRCVRIAPEISKASLIKKEAERYILQEDIPGNFILTIKEHTLIPSAGIDESNGNGYYVLWPKFTSKLLKEIHGWLRKVFSIEKLALIATDSHTIPLRYGVIGISIGFFGLEPLYDYRGTSDIFGRKLKHTKTNIVDALAAMGVLLMGEADEQTPIIIVRGAEFVRFTDRQTFKKLVIPMDEDLYRPLLAVFDRKA